MSELLEALEYDKSPSFLSSDLLRSPSEHAHIFRRALKSFDLRGAYVVQGSPVKDRLVTVPVVYVAEAESIERADRIHRQVWNENIVPFLIVKLPTHLRLYSGFSFAHAPSQSDLLPPGKQAGVLEASIGLGDVLKRLAEFRASSIDDGTIWRVRGHQLQTEDKVDRRLLRNLRELGEWLHNEQHIARETAHAVIGKLVYLRYLRDRGILSNWRMEQLGIDPALLTSSSATKEALQDLVCRVDDWLNGSVFPVNFKALTVAQLRRVMSVFLGDETTGQQNFDFRAYDFAHIPIETLSIIYEQFLSIEDRQGEQGAYYTPVPVVNFMISELESQCPAKTGMRILDPSCGSGAFLVQCYRRLAESCYYNSAEKPKPSDLRRLLVDSIFGYDRDPDACRVTHLSLILAMLDYVDPPDLNRTPNFKLPGLEENIRTKDFFDVAAVESGSFEWIVGNPPWFELTNSRKQDRSALEWVEEHRSDPITENQVAEAFTWKVLKHLSSSGAVALLLPATTLFKKQRTFRRRFFAEVDLWFVANFSNLREVLFGRRARRAAAAFFYRPLLDGSRGKQSTTVFSPLLINQQIGGRNEPGHLSETWALVPDSTELQAVEHSETRDGDFLPWKSLMWGSALDCELIRRTERRFTSLEELASEHKLHVYQGVELRHHSANEPLDRHSELVGKLELVLPGKLDRIHSIPLSMLAPIESTRAYIRKGRSLPLVICQPPHIFVHATRSAAVFSDRHFVIPGRQIGISGNRQNEKLLRAVTAYLNSDFVRYHQFLCSPEWGVTLGRATLDALKRLPVPLMEATAIERLAQLQRRLAAAAKPSDMDDLEAELNSVVFSLLELTEADRVLVEDLVSIRMLARSGNVAPEHVRRPVGAELERYAAALRSTLNEFIENSVTSMTHKVDVFTASETGIVRVALAKPSDLGAVHDEGTFTSDQAAQVAGLEALLQREHGQWLYFDRNLVIVRDDGTYLFKPMQRIWWTRTQAILDAHEAVAAALSPIETNS
ncbi:MAG: N-6 DNA methylase [Hyphomicrobium sp.]